MKASWLRAGEGALLLRFAEETADAAHAQVVRAFEALNGWNHPALLNLHPAYRSLLVEFDPLKLDYGEWVALVGERLRTAPGEIRGMGRRQVEIPVIYDGEDLAEVARLHGLTPQEVIRLHSGALYTVRFLGFQPGFPYLAGLPPRLETPRLSTPRLKVPAGSVAIAGQQAGIYPLASPGGWRILGRTPLALFRPEEDPPALLRMGDEVRFVPIGEGEGARA